MGAIRGISNPYDRDPYQKRLGYLTQRNDHVGTQQEDGHLQVKVRDLVTSGNKGQNYQNKLQE